MIRCEMRPVACLTLALLTACSGSKGDFFVDEAGDDLALAGKDNTTFEQAIQRQECNGMSDVEDGAGEVPTSIEDLPAFEVAEDRGSYLIMNEVDEGWSKANSIPDLWQRRKAFFHVVTHELFKVHPDDSKQILIYTTPMAFGGSNRGGTLIELKRPEIYGIGMHHLDHPGYFPWPAETPNPPFFNLTGESNLTGLVLNSRWDQYVMGNGTLNDTLIRRAFGQESAHDRLAYSCYIDENGQKNWDLLDPNEATHWGFYHHSAHSPMEGLHWTEMDGGAFRGVVKGSNYPLAFSDLDLYNLGLLDAQDVAPTFIIRNEHNCVADGEPLDRCPRRGTRSFSPRYKTLMVEGTREEVTIDDIIACEGPRDPSNENSDRSLIVMVVKHPSETLSGLEKEQIARIVERVHVVWNEMTRGLSRIQNNSALPTQ